MTAVLTKRLSAYERTAVITDDRSLLAALRELIAAEEEKTDCDWDFVAEATDAILSLEGEDVDSFEATDADAAAFRASVQSEADRAEMIANEAFGDVERRAVIRRDVASAKPTKKIKWIIPLAAALTALLIGGAIAGAYYLDIFSMDSDTYKSLPVGTVITDGNDEVYKSDARTSVPEYSALAGDEKYASLLIPSPLPDGWSVKRVVTDTLAKASLVETYLEAGEGRTARIKAQLGLGIRLELPTEKIGAYDVFVSEYDGVTQGEFTVGEDYYLVQASDRAALEAIIGSLEAMK